MRRRFLVLLASMGLAFLASVALIEWKTRPARRAASIAAQGPAVPVPPPPAANTVPAPVRGPPAATTAAAPSPALARAGEPERARPPRSPPVPGAPRVEFAFKLDRRLTAGLHMGERWVSPRTYTSTGDPKSVTVEARARVVGDRGQRSRVKTAWWASEPDMVEVSPEEGDEVKLTVWRPGESRVTVTSGSASGELTVRAARVGEALRVDIVR